MLAPLPPIAAPAPLPVIIEPTVAPSGERAVGRPWGGHYFFDATINGQPIPLLFDTGATVVSLRAEDAMRVGIDPSTLIYSAQVRTANGVAQVAPVTLAVFTVGTITRHNIPAMIARPGVLSFNLLGQSFLRHVAGYEDTGHGLVIKGGS